MAKISASSVLKACLSLIIKSIRARGLQQLVRFETKMFMTRVLFVTYDSEFRNVDRNLCISM